MPGGRASPDGAASGAAAAAGAAGGGGSCGADALDPDCDDERDLLWLWLWLWLRDDERDAERDFSLCDAERDFCSTGAGAAAAATLEDDGDECSRLLAGLPARVCDGAEADGADFDADGADCEEVDARLSDLPGEINFGSGYADGGATSFTIGLALRSDFSAFSDLPGEITFGVG